ncbi:hypothetical protein HPP92_000395 [Vanilla planifolia]|uniref:ATP-dependent Clp protease proteolytic subunit n=2 Tax=Vanilla planifolia TaxID=51239 RepID=A0A835S0I9_VANPL|nr:hypothetical protein HPP92_000395 [Vanilla planifolia]
MAAILSFTSSTMAVPSPVYSPIPSSVAQSHNTLFSHFQNPRLPFLSARNLVKARKRWSSPMAVYSSGYRMLDQGARQGIWSIRDDLIVPSTPFIPMEVQSGQTPAMVQENLQGVVNQLLRHRIVRCGGEVDDEMARVVVSQLLYLDAIDPTKDIIMYVNSPGGSVTAGMAMFDTMRHVRPDVCTFCVGLAASMGAFLLSAGAKGKRFSLPSSRIMIHQPLGGAPRFTN